jgi:hypothetical protein
MPPEPAASPVPWPEVPAASVRALVGARLCPACGVGLTGRQRSACSARCRRARSRQRQTATTAVEFATLWDRVAELDAENAVLRQQVAELTQMFVNVKRQWQARSR